MFKKRTRFNILIFLLPAVIFTVIFFILPAPITTFMAFTGMDYKFQWNFVGFKNFIRIMHDPLIRKITSVTVWYILGTLLIFNTTFGLVLAILTSYLSEKVGVFFRGTWLLPRFTPPIVYGVIWLWILSPNRSGLLNGMLMTLFGLDKPISWIIKYPLQVIILTNGLIGASMGMVIFASAIQSISRDYFWASRVDGANWWQEIRYIILPMIKWPVAFITAYQTLSLLTSYEYILIITQGGPYYKSTVWSLYSYLVAFSSYSGTFEFGYGAALSTVLVVIGIIASIFYWKVFKMGAMIQPSKIEF